MIWLTKDSCINVYNNNHTKAQWLTLLDDTMVKGKGDDHKSVFACITCLEDIEEHEGMLLKDEKLINKQSSPNYCFKLTCRS